MIRFSIILSPTPSEWSLRSGIPSTMYVFMILHLACYMSHSSHPP